MFNPPIKIKNKEGRPAVVRLTTPGRSAVASILLVGHGATEIFSHFWEGPRLPSPGSEAAAKPLFGRFRFPDSGRTEARPAEELVVHLVEPEQIEFHCHGGQAVQESIESALLTAGAIRRSWQDVFCPIGLSPDCRQRDIALRLLPLAPTQRTAQILLDQFNGALQNEMEQIERLDEQIGNQLDGESSFAAEKQRRLDRLRENAELGKHLVEPFSVVLAGKANAGKSSLFNAILGFQRSIASARPGTTRDTVAGEIALEGFPIRLIDTAGFRDLPESFDATDFDHDLERQGIERSKRSMADTDLIVWLIDSSEEHDDQPPISPTNNVLFCFNKIDLPGRRPDIATGIPTDAIRMSAETGEGIPQLLEQICRRLVPRPPLPFEGVPLSL